MRVFLTSPLCVCVYLACRTSPVAAGSRAVGGRPENAGHGETRESPRGPSDPEPGGRRGAIEAGRETF